MVQLDEMYGVWIGYFGKLGSFRYQKRFQFENKYCFVKLIAEMHELFSRQIVP